jgi:hypothetical protein
MTRITIGLTLASLVALFIAYAKGVSVIHGGDALSHMYWATAALVAVALANFIAVAHLARSERMLRRFRALCEKHNISFEGLE